jgi:UMF1 family MFS transporter
LGSIVLYSYLPEIAFPEQQDRVSAKGFMFAGSLILLGFNLTMGMMPEWYGISDGSLPAYFFFIGWHLVDWFCTNYFYHLPIIFFTRNRRKTIS